MTGPPSQVLTINGVEVDLAAEVLRDRHGVTVPMRRQAFAVLRHLLGNPGRLVAKDELMAAVWPGIAVTDDSLVQCIHEIRRALRDESHMVLRTVPRRGYRLVLPGASAASAAPVRARRWRLAAAAIAVGLLLGLVAAAWNRAPPVPAGLSVAVLPFDDFDGDPRQVRFAAAFTEDLITELARTTASW